MWRNLIVGVFVLLAFTWASAQQSQETLSGSGKPNPTSLEGCISGGHGGYTLTDDQGTQYYLTGTSADMSSYVGQKVKVEGMQTSNAVQGAGGFPTSNVDVGTMPTFKVDSVSKISGSCKQSDQ
jgi:hypothetical protein